MTEVSDADGVAVDPQLATTIKVAQSRSIKWAVRQKRALQRASDRRSLQDCRCVASIQAERQPDRGLIMGGLRASIACAEDLHVRDVYIIFLLLVEGRVGRLSAPVATCPITACRVLLAPLMRRDIERAPWRIAGTRSAFR